MKKHNKKILIVGGVIVTAGFCYILRKHDIELNEHKDIMETLGRTMDVLLLDNAALKSVIAQDRNILNGLSEATDIIVEENPITR